MTNLQRHIFFTASLLGCAAVIIGAFGAHYLKTIFSIEQLTSFETGVRYQFYHTLALCWLGYLAAQKSNLLRNAFYFFTSGIVCFSGSIYALNLLKQQGIVGIKGLGMLTPIGGLLLVCGWLCCAIYFLQKKSN